MPNDLYTGFWTNRDHSQILGATLTLSVEHATLLTNFLSVLISTLIVDSLFRIFVIVLYSRHPLPPYPQGPVGQVYVSLRNSNSVSIPRKELLKSIFAPNTNKRSRVIALILLTPCVLLLCFKVGSFAIPGLIISSSADDIALLKPGVCGFKAPNITDEDNVFLGPSNELWETTQSRSYAAQRYAKAASAFTTELIFPVDTLPFDVAHNVTCPFADYFCLLGPLGAVQFDTGPLDSHQHLGINAPEQDRIQYRWRSTCTPLNITGHATVLRDTVYEGTIVSKDEPIIEVNLGPLAAFEKNYTFLYKQNFLDATGYDVRYFYVSFCTYEAVY